MLLDPLNLQKADFPVRRPVKILIHGYTGHRDFAPNTFIRPVLLQHENVYVISPDYGPLVREPCYTSAVENLPLAARCLAQLINNLVDGGIVQNEDLHVIGFSLGAQVAGQTANYVKKKLQRITGEWGCCCDVCKLYVVSIVFTSRTGSCEALVHHRW